MRLVALRKEFSIVSLKGFGKFSSSSGFKVETTRAGKNQKPAKKFFQAIPVDLCGFRLKYPTMLASGVLGISFDLFPRIISSGCGAIVTKSIGVEPRAGYKNPTMTGVEGGYLNAIGLANPGVEIFREELRGFNEVLSNKSTPLVVSIFADSPENFAKIAGILNEQDFLAFELNLSCPHVKDVGSEIGGDLELSSKVIKAVKRETSKPLLVKMPASIMNASVWGKTIEEAGADAIVAINTIRAMTVDIASQTPVLSNKIGGLSGAAIRPVGVRAVYELFEAVKIPIIGVGGVFEWFHAAEYYLAGATCVQIGSAMATGFLDTFGKVNVGISSYMKDQGFTSLKEMIGAAHH
jgi:dihydroorotate dehydrogenase (NAD+) catalytic subunit